MLECSFMQRVGNTSKTINKPPSWAKRSLIGATMMAAGLGLTGAATTPAQRKELMNRGRQVTADLAKQLHDSAFPPPDIGSSTPTADELETMKIESGIAEAAMYENKLTRRLKEAKEISQSQELQDRLKSLGIKVSAIDDSFKNKNFEKMKKGFKTYSDVSVLDAIANLPNDTTELPYLCFERLLTQENQVVDIQKRLADRDPQWAEKFKSYLKENKAKYPAIPDGFDLTNEFLLEQFSKRTLVKPLEYVNFLTFPSSKVKKEFEKQFSGAGPLKTWSLRVNVVCSNVAGALGDFEKKIRQESN